MSSASSSPAREWTDEDGEPLGDWEPIDFDTYRTLRADGDQTVFSTLTDPDGRFGTPQIYTSWGLRGADVPTVDARDYLHPDGALERQVYRRFVPRIKEKTHASQ